MRRIPVRVVGLVLLVVLAGCLGPLGSGDAVDDPRAGSTETGETAAVEGGEATAASRGSAGTGPGTGPWGERVVVGVRSSAEPGRDYAALVREATEFWEANAEQYTGYPIQYEVRPDAPDPDLVVEFVETVPDCNGVGDAAGCAPVITDSRQIDRPETVYVRGGLSNSSTVLVVEHELGHTLGLGHDDAPADVMAARSVLYTQPRTDAVDRTFPWRNGSFAVYVDDRNASDPDRADEQIAHALDYYEAGAEGMPSNLSFSRVDDPDAAQVVVTFTDSSPCGAGAGSCIETVGPDPDGDGAVETYARIRIVLVSLDTEAVGWHTGYWLAHGLGAEADADKPAPFRNATYRERRSRWWES